MTLDPAAADPLRERANELYWSSAETVDQIARQLGISRNAMYSSVRPIPAGASCVHCDEALLFTNRTTRAARTAFCPVCEIQVTMGEETSGEAGPLAQGNGAARVEPVPPPRPGLIAQVKEELAQVPPDRAAKIGGAAALGVAVGAAAAKVLRKR